jgi:hypothetical protein
MTGYPGTHQHQALLRAIANHYQNDPRMLAVIVFGSLGRGNWDAYSDLDMDVIIADGAPFDLPAELAQLEAPCAAAGERLALLIPEGSDSADLVFASLLQLSIRYHTLPETSPAIVESMLVLTSALEPAAIAAAGEANKRPEGAALDELLARCLRYSVVAQVGVQRRRVWYTVEMLQRMRSLLMEIYTRTHGGQRAMQYFEEQADQRLQQKLGAALPGYEQPSLRRALTALLDMLEDDLPDLSNGQLRLGAAQLALLERVRQAVDSAIHE